MKKEYYLNKVAEFRQKVQTARTKENLQGLASALGSLGNDLAEEGNYQEAIRLHEEAREHYSAVLERDGEAQSCFNLAGIYQVGLKRNEEAIKYYREGLKLVTIPELSQ